MPNIDVNGETIDYPDVGDPNWGDNATNFAIQTSAALGKIGLSSGTSVDITQTLDVTGNTTLDANLSVGGNASVTGDISASGNLSVNGNTTLGDASGDSLTINSNNVSIPNGLNFDSNTFVINAATNRIGIGGPSPGVPLEVQADSAAFGIDIKGRSADNIGLLRFLNNAGSSRYRIGVYPSDAFSISNASSVETLTIAQNGQLNAVIPGGSTLYPGYLCRAWINFDGSTGSGNTIRGSGNVSSVTRNSTGTYTISIDIDMPDANYVICGNTVNTAGGKAVVCVFSYSSGSFVITTSPGLAGTGLENSASIFISVFR